MPFEITAPSNTKDFKFKQSSYTDVPQTPFRMVVWGNSGAGKGVVLSRMITDIFDQVFVSVHIWSSSIRVDHSWKPVRDWMEKNDIPPEKHLHENFDESKVVEILNEQREVIEYVKRKGGKLPQMLLIFDDLAESPQAMKSQAIQMLFLRGRHMACSVAVSIQKFRAINNVVRMNATDLLVFTSIRNMKDLSAFLEESSALVDERRLMEIYTQAKRKSPYAFLWLKQQGSVDDLVHVGFNPAEKLSV